MTLTLNERKEIVRHVPWVKELKAPTQCMGYKAGSNGNPNKRCKNLARWRYTALKRSWCRFWDTETRGYVKTGNVCWNHLFSRGFYGDMDEESRINKWLKKYDPVRFADAGQEIKVEDESNE